MESYGCVSDGGLLAMLLFGMMCGAFTVGAVAVCGGDPALWRARWARRRRFNDHVRELLALGYSPDDARHSAEARMLEEARACERALT